MPVMWYGVGGGDGRAVSKRPGAADREQPKKEGGGSCCSRLPRAIAAAAPGGRARGDQARSRRARVVGARPRAGGRRHARGARPGQPPSVLLLLLPLGFCCCRRGGWRVARPAAARAARAAVTAAKGDRRPPKRTHGCFVFPREKKAKRTIKGWGRRREFWGESSAALPPPPLPTAAWSACAFRPSPAPRARATHKTNTRRRDSPTRALPSNTRAPSARRTFPIRRRRRTRAKGDSPSFEATGEEELLPTAARGRGHLESTTERKNALRNSGAVLPDLTGASRHGLRDGSERGERQSEKQLILLFLRSRASAEPDPCSPRTAPGGRIPPTRAHTRTNRPHHRPQVPPPALDPARVANCSAPERQQKRRSRRRRRTDGRAA